MPPALRMQIFAQGYREIAVSRRNMAIAARRPRMFFKEFVIPDMERIEQQLFSSQGRRGGGSWAGLSSATIATKVRKNQDPRINIADGNLLYTLEDSDAPYAIRRIDGFSLFFGSKSPGAAQSQEHRPILKFTKFDHRRWAKWFVEYVLRYGRRV